MTARLWEKMDGDRIWLENPRRKRRRKAGGRKRRRGRFVKGSAAAKRYMASIRPNRHRKRRKKRARRNYGTTPATAWASNRGGRVKRRRKSHSRRRYRRNPGGGGSAFSVGGIMSRLKRGAVNALYVVGGRVGAGLVPALAGLKADGTPRLPSTGVAGFVVVGITAIGLGELVRKFMRNASAAEYVVAGALSRPFETLVKSFNITKVNQALSAYPSYDGFSFDGYPPRAAVDAGGHLNGIPGAMESGQATIEGAI